MDKKLNPLDGEIDLLGDNVSDIIRKLNPLTGRLELVYSASSYIQKVNPFIGDFDLVSGEAPSYIIKTLTGNGYINLTNAIANELIYVKLYGGTRQGLPEGYTQLDGITGDGNAYIDLNMQLTEDDEADVYFTKPSQLASSNVFGGRTSATSNNISVIIASSGNAVLDFNNSDYTDYRLNTSISLNTQYKAVLSKSGRYIYQGDTLIDSNTTDCGDTIETPGTYLFHLAGSGLTSKFAGTINRCVIKGKKDLIPCKDSNNVVGMYDIINGVFYTNANETGSFTAGNEITTPSPSYPMNIICNNGTIKYQTYGLPVGYTKLDYIEMNNSVYYTITGFKLTGHDTVRFSFEPTQAQPACNVLGAYTTASATDNWSLYIGYSSANYLRYGNGTYNSQVNSNTKYDVVIGPTGTSGMKNDSTWTEQTFTCSVDLNIGITGTTATSAKFIGKMYGNIIVDGRLNLVPCIRNSDSVIGYYDTVGSTFYAPTWTSGDGPVAGNTETPYVYTDGTTETVEDELGNTATAENLFSIGDIKDVQEILSGHITRNIGIKVLDGTENWQFATQLLNYMYSLQIDDMFAESSSVTSNRQSPYSTHFERSTNWISGQAARQNKIQAYTDSQSNTYLGLGYGTPSSANLNDFKQRLADQYIAGTPVIIVYPLKTPTTETVTGQTLNIQDGSNRIGITQASINNLPIEVKYRATS